MDAASLSTVTAVALAPYISYLLKGVQFVGEKVIGAAADGIGKLGFRKATEIWERVRSRSADMPKLAKAAELVAVDSTDQDSLKLLAKAILDLFSKDNAIRAEILGLLGGEDSAQEIIADGGSNVEKIRLDLTGGGTVSIVATNESSIKDVSIKKR